MSRRAARFIAVLTIIIMVASFLTILFASSAKASVGDAAARVTATVSPKINVSKTGAWSKYKILFAPSESSEISYYRARAKVYAYRQGLYTTMTGMIAEVNVYSNFNKDVPACSSVRRIYMDPSPIAGYDPPRFSMKCISGSDITLQSDQWLFPLRRYSPALGDRTTNVFVKVDRRTFVLDTSLTTPSVYISG